MRILTLADVREDPNRGASGTEFQTVAALRRLGCEVVSIWEPQLGRRIAHGNLHLLLELPRTYERAVRRALKSSRYDVFHVNQPHGYRAVRTVHELSPRSVFIHRSHGFEPRIDEDLARWRARFETAERPLFRRLASAAIQPFLRRHSVLIANEADGHIVSAAACREYLVQKLAVPAERVAVIPQAPPAEYSTVPAAAMSPERLRVILHVGQFAFFKAPMIVAESMNFLARRNDVSFIWVCDRADHDRVRDLLSDIARERVELLHWMPQDELRAVFDRSGILLFPSLAEGFGKVVIEAMSRGLCVVASDISGPREVISNGSSGLLVPAGDATAMSQAAERLLDDPDKAREISRAAVDTARNYSWDRVARETADFYTARLRAKSLE